MFLKLFFIKSEHYKGSDELLLSHFHNLKCFPIAIPPGIEEFSTFSHPTNAWYIHSWKWINGTLCFVVFFFFFHLPQRIPEVMHIPVMYSRKELTESLKRGELRSYRLRENYFKRSFLQRVLCSQSLKINFKVLIGAV